MAVYINKTPQKMALVQYMPNCICIGNAGSTKLEHQVQDTTEMDYRTRDALLRDHSQDREEDSPTQQESQQAIMRHDDAPPPYPGSPNDPHRHSIPLPTSSPPIDPDSTTEYISECFSPATTQSDFIDREMSCHDTASELLQSVPQNSQKGLPDDLLPSSNPHTSREWSDQQNNFSVNTSGKNVVGGK